MAEIRETPNFIEFKGAVTGGTGMEINEPAVQINLPTIDNYTHGLGDDPALLSEIERALAPIRLGLLFSNAPIPETSAPFTIDTPFLVYSNPVAGRGGKPFRYLIDFLKMRDKGRVQFAGDLEFYNTRSSSTERVAAILNIVKKFNPLHPPDILVIGGDGTFCEMATAAMEAKRQGYIPRIIPGPGGTANDMRGEFGLPKSAMQLPAFLRSAIVVHMDVVMASLDNGPEKLLLHSQGNGVSGEVFAEAHARRSATGKITIPAYIRGVIKGIKNAKVFYVSVNGGELMPTGEVLTLSNSSLMAYLSRIPMPRRGARILIIPLNPDAFGPARISHGLAAIRDAISRRIRFALGDQSVIDGRHRLAGLEPKHVVDVSPGQEVRLNFFDAEGRPIKVPGILNGDPTLQPAHQVRIRTTGETVPAVAASNSGIAVRHGLTKPSTIGAAMLGRAMMIVRPTDTVFTVALIAAYEASKDILEFSPGERLALDGGMLIGNLAGTAYAAWKMSSIEMMPAAILGLPSAVLGYQLFAAAADELGKRTDTEQLTYNHASNALAGWTGSAAALFATFKWWGENAIRGAARNIGGFAVRHIGGAGMALEGFIAGIASFAGSTLTTLPIIMPRALLDPETILPYSKIPEGA